MSGATPAGGQPGQESGAASPQGGQEPTGTQGQPGAQDHGQEPGQQAPQDGQGNQDTWTPERALEHVTDPAARTYLEKLARDAAESRREAANYRTQFQTAQQERDALARQNESDADRIAREAQEAADERETLRKENRDLRVGAALDTAVRDAGAFNPQTVASLLDAQVEVDDKGNPANIAAILANLKRTDPYLFKRDSADAGAGAGAAGAATPTTNMNDFIRSTRR